MIKFLFIIASIVLSVLLVFQGWREFPTIDKLYTLGFLLLAQLGIILQETQEIKNKL